MQENITAPHVFMTDQPAPPKTGLSGAFDEEKPALFGAADLDIVINKTNPDSVVVAHGTPLAAYIVSARYDSSDFSVTCYSKAGNAFDLGVRIDPRLRDHMKTAKSIGFYYVTGGQTMDFILVPLEPSK